MIYPKIARRTVDAAAVYIIMYILVLAATLGATPNPIYNGLKMKAPPRPKAFPKKAARKEKTSILMRILLLAKSISDGHVALYFFFSMSSLRTTLTLYQITSRHSMIKPVNNSQLGAPHLSKSAIESFFGEPRRRLTSMPSKVNPRF